jgi:hypothetical protein
MGTPSINFLALTSASSSLGRTLDGALRPRYIFLLAPALADPGLALDLRFAELRIKGWLSCVAAVDGHIAKQDLPQDLGMEPGAREQ